MYESTLREDAQLPVGVEAPGGERPREDQPAGEGGEDEQNALHRTSWLGHRFASDTGGDDGRSKRISKSGQRMRKKSPA